MKKHRISSLEILETRQLLAGEEEYDESYLENPLEIPFLTNIVKLSIGITGLYFTASKMISTLSEVKESSIFTENTLTYSLCLPAYLNMFSASFAASIQQLFFVATDTQVLFKNSFSESIISDASKSSAKAKLYKDFPRELPALMASTAGLLGAGGVMMSFSIHMAKKAFAKGCMLFTLTSPFLLIGFARGTELIITNMPDALDQSVTLYQGIYNKVKSLS